MHNFSKPFTTLTFTYGLLLTILIFSSGVQSHTITNGSFTKTHLISLKQRTKELFEHGWNSYMNNAYPADELRPLSCSNYERVRDVQNINRNDVLGNYSVTFLDTITTFAIMGEVEQFETYVEMLRDLTFDLDSTVQVFETTIRALGSLLSAHLYSSDKFKTQNYDGFLLDLAKDLGDRLLVAYDNDNELPVARINLRYGVEGIPQNLIHETCTAGAASPMLELTLLSILTNDPKYEHYSKRTFLRLWKSRGKLDLLPMSFDPINGKWFDAVTGVGASIDSFYEYALKGAILFNDDELLEIWTKSYQALSTHSKLEWFFANVHVETGAIINPWIDALSAFFPGVLVLAGEVEDAIKAHQPFIKLWDNYGGIPERWDYLSPTRSGFCTGEVEPITLEWYPLRPEFIESTYYLYRATKDPIYLRVGEKILEDFSTVFRVECGFSGYSDIRIGSRQDRMESFVLSETLMYLYLLFDEQNELNHQLDFVFSTEGHPLWIPKKALRDYKETRAISSIDLSDVSELLRNETSVSNLISKLSSWPRDELQLALDYIYGLFNDSSGKEDLVPILLDTVDREIDLLGGVGRSEWIDVCPIYNDGDGFFSKVVSDPKFFILDSKFSEQWNFSSLDSIELDFSFNSIFGDPNAVCYREPSVNLWDFKIGNGVASEYVSLNYVDSSGDAWVNSIDGVRLKLELLELNKVDFSNRLIDREFLLDFADDSIESSGERTCGLTDNKIESVLRVMTFNGVNVDSNTTIYISRANLDQNLIESKTIGLSRKGHLVLGNFLVSNLRLADEDLWSSK